MSEIEIYRRLDSLVVAFPGKAVAPDDEEELEVVLSEYVEDFIDLLPEDLRKLWEEGFPSYTEDFVEHGYFVWHYWKNDQPEELHEIFDKRGVEVIEFLVYYEVI